MGSDLTDLVERSASFEEIVWRSARHFTSLIHMRNTGTDAPIRLDERDSYYEERHREAIQNWTKYVNMSASDLEGAQRELDVEYEKLLQNARESITQNDLARNKLLSMRERIVAWIPPTPNHVELKNYMLRTLDHGLEDHSNKYYLQILEYKKLDLTKWLQDKILDAKRAVARYADRMAEERAAIQTDNNWILDLDESVPIPAALKGFLSRKDRTK